MRRTAVRAARPVEQFLQYSLLGLLASGYFALAGSGALDLPSLIVTGAGLFLRLLIIAGFVRLEIEPVWVAAATLAYIGFYPIDLMYVSGEFIPATVHLICFLAVVRVLTASTSRDYFFVKIIAFLQMVAATLLSSSVTFFVCLVFFIGFGVATFCCSELRRSSLRPGQIVVEHSRGFYGRLAALTATVTAAVVLMTAGLFFVLPRTARAAFRSMISERYHLPGFSNEVRLGQIGELKQQSTPVMHVRVEAPNDRAALKWRGAALTQFDGSRWYNPPAAPERIRLIAGPTPLAADVQRRRPGPRLSYQVRIGPVDADALFFAGTPEFLNIDDLSIVYRGLGESYRTGSFTAEGREYKAIGYLSDLSAAPSAELGELDRDQFNELLLLPGSTDRRIFALAREAGKGNTALERAQAIERYLRTQYSYTTELPQAQPADPLAYFLFDRRKGHCEYFASAMAVMLRGIHIPARVATGFQSGTYNPLTGWHVIRASDAHSWVEAWLPERGWVTFDPTPPDTNPARNAGLLASLLLYADAAETLWHDWVVGYSLDRQADLVSRAERSSRLLSSALPHNPDIAGWTKRSIEGMLPALIRTGAAFLFLIALWWFGPRLLDALRARRHAMRVLKGGAVASDAALLYARMLRILQRRGLEKPAWLTPMEFARIVPPAHHPTLVEQITAAYQDLRYAGKADAGPRMVQLLQELERAR